MFKCRITFGCLCALAISGIAQAAPMGAYWIEVPVVDDPTDSADLSGLRSFDLFIQVHPDDHVYVVDSLTTQNTGIALGAGQDFFNHEFGGNTPTDPEIINGFFPDIEFDSRFQMGSLPFDRIVQVAAFDWDPAGMRGTAFTTVEGEGPLPGLPNAGGGFWAGRFTVNSVGAFGDDTSGLGEYMGGQFFLSGSGPNGDFGMQIASTGVINVPNAFAVPAPTAAAILVALPVMTGTRRRSR